MPQYGFLSVGHGFGFKGLTGFKGFKGFRV